MNFKLHLWICTCSLYTFTHALTDFFVFVHERFKSFYIYIYFVIIVNTSHLHCSRIRYTRYTRSTVKLSKVTLYRVPGGHATATQHIEWTPTKVYPSSRPLFAAVADRKSLLLELQKAVGSLYDKVNSMSINTQEFLTLGTPSTVVNPAKNFYSVIL